MEPLTDSPVGYLRKTMDLIGGKLSDILFIGAGCYLLLYSLVSNAFSFNYEMGSNAQYDLAYLLLLLPLSAIVRLRSARMILYGAIVVLPLLAGTLAICFSKAYTFSNEHFTSIFFFFFFFCLALQAQKKSIQIFVQILCGSYLLEIALSVNQFLCGHELTGSFGNSGVFACYITCGIPFMCYILTPALKLGIGGNDRSQHLGKEWSLLRNTSTSVLCIALTAYIAFVLFQTRSRTAMICLTVLFACGCFYFSSRLRAHMSWKWRFSIIFLLAPPIVYAGAYLYQMKAQSASGRLLAMKITAAHFWDEFALGTGLGRLTYFFPNWQSAYLGQRIQSAADVRQFLSAGEDYLIFNEYLQLFKEVGLLGLIAFLIILYYILSSKSPKSSQLLLAAKWTVIAVLCCGFTSYPLHVNYFLLLLALCSAIAFKLRENSIFSHFPSLRLFAFSLKVSRPLLLIVSLLAIGFGTRTLLAVNCWRAYPEDLDSYSKNLKMLQNDGKFLAQYGTILSNDLKKQDSALLMLQEGNKLFVSANSVEYAAMISSRLGKYDMALENYKWLSGYVPSKFRYRYEMLKIYRAIGDTSQVKKTGSFILSMPIKIPSLEVNQIIDGTTAILSRQQNVSNHVP